LDKFAWLAFVLPVPVCLQVDKDRLFSTTKLAHLAHLCRGEVCLLSDTKGYD